MGSLGAQPESGDEPLDARAVLDAGGESPDRLIDALHRRLGELAVGQVVEIASHQPESHATLLSWCRLTGQTLVRVWRDGVELRLWIRKALPLANEGRIPSGSVVAERKEHAMSQPLLQDLDVGVLREAIQSEYAEVAEHPEQGFHFHTGRPLARLLGYDNAWLDGLPEGSIASFAGTGNPFAIGPLAPGERVVDVGCGAGIDSLIAARMVGPTGRVVGVDMTPAMLAKARRSGVELGLLQVEFRDGFGEALPVADGWADVVISNGVLNLMPDKAAALGEMARVLKPGGRLQLGDILVQRAVPESARRRIDLWTG
jgi:2-polyprenyl-3-methyl-5-hydroxy-6-metoxy-1,4-benzoquinol methylase/TusA-related sulfurtransferase